MEAFDGCKAKTLHIWGKDYSVGTLCIEAKKKVSPGEVSLKKVLRSSF